MNLKNLKNHVEKQELLIKLYHELLQGTPSTTKETKIQQTKAIVAKEEILKNNFEIKKIIEQIREEEVQ